MASKTRRGLSISKTHRTKSPRIIKILCIKDKLLRLKFSTQMGRRAIAVTRATLRDHMAVAITMKERHALSGPTTRSQTRIRVQSKLVASMNLQQLIRANQPQSTKKDKRRKRQVELASETKRTISKRL